MLDEIARLSVTDEAVRHQEAGRFLDMASILIDHIDRHPSDGRAHALLAQAYLNLRRDDDAISSLENARVLVPEDDLFLRNLARIRLIQRQLPEAEAAASKAYNRNPLDAENCLVLGAAFLARGDFVQASHYTEAALAVKADYPNGLIQRARIAIHNKNFDVALIDSQRAVELAPFLAQGWLLLATSHHQTENISAAIDALSHFVCLQPNDGGAIITLGQWQNQTKRFDNALATFEKAVRTSPELLAAWIGYGSLLQQANRLDEAGHAYERALELQPSQGDVWNNLGVIHKTKGRLDKAVEAYKMACQLDPERLLFQANLGWTLIHTDQHDEAESVFRHASTLESGPSLAVLQGQAFLAERAGNFAEAIKSLTQMLTMQPQNADLRQKLDALQEKERRQRNQTGALAKPRSRKLAQIAATIGTHLRNGQYKQAERKARAALAIDRHDVQILCQLGSALTHLKRYTEAEGIYLKALAVQPDLIPALRTSAALCALRKDMVQADAFLQRALAVLPDDPDILIQYGSEVLAASHRFEAAERVIRKALSLKPGSTQALLNISQLLTDQRKLEEAAEFALAAQQTFGEAAPLEWLKALALVFIQCGMKAEAKALLESCLARDPSDRSDARLLLGGLGFAPLPPRASDRFLTELYDTRAQYWGAKNQNYHGASLVAAALSHHTSNAPGLDILDAGCGSGLVGSLVHHQAGRLDGVDFSQAMLDRARALAIYDDLIQGDLVAAMADRPGHYDAITCAATLIHFGDLSVAFDAASEALRGNGLFLFTLFPYEGSDEAEFGLAPLELAGAGCFAHSESYVRRVAGFSGFTIEAINREIHEQNRGKPQMCFMVTLRRTLSGAPQA